jgi:hypothetical protein
VLGGGAPRRQATRFDGCCTSRLRSFDVTPEIAAFGETVQPARLIFPRPGLLLALLGITSCGLGVPFAEAEKGHVMTILPRLKALVRISDQI